MFILYRVLDYCRVGSLENNHWVESEYSTDYCRVGSLESSEATKCAGIFDYCRVGRLEKTCNGARL